ncbi:preprotein translocase subunit SecA [Paraliobacillus quinghaiensis]|uniref:Preprotein translocase subunit SecA n=1 Tax=Paraliobacillus quinghaiensis TaxID=470815 RepID=A0A917TYZ5_9BACI|nr:SEC-C metal-binding domain-containing protein [Paraliobacillus quinghaiensis]GGM42445.1 preprotein translocase subunit SecA [Paraliobacillus quinghaiensis]
MITTKDKTLLTDAIEGAKSIRAQQDKKNEQHLFQAIEDLQAPLTVHLNRLTKQQMDKIRKKLNLKGISSLNKAALAKELERLIPENIEKFFNIIDQERYELVTSICENNGIALADDVPLSKVEALMEFGVIYLGIYDKQKILTIPTDLIELFKQQDHDRIEAIVQRNQEWIQLTNGMLYYYGVLEEVSIVSKIEAILKQDINSHDYFNVIGEASAYGQIKPNVFGFSDERVVDPHKILAEHAKRPSVPFYPFTKEQLLKAGEPGYVDRTPAMKKFIQFLIKQHDLDEQFADEIAYQFTNMINAETSPSVMMQYLQSSIEISSFESQQQIADEIMTLSNNTRMWTLKGHMPRDLSQNRPAVKAKNNVADIRSRKKIGRNQPCPCGSGKKYKKCCLK